MTRKRKKSTNNRRGRGNPKQRRGGERNGNWSSKNAGKLTSFPAMTLHGIWLVIRLMVEGWIYSTRVVKSPQTLFQDAPSQFANLGIAMESGTDRLPRRTGLCVLFHAHQLLIVSSGPWTKWWSTRWIHGSWWNVS